ncbi:hypothetical protein LCGC14_1420690 [marine sediment metagenome]|uniref:Uncharacterized protein n=1 Tax=marine sediment metagenome TaxID=412755 RepID=A0A0F9JRZ1_9ZZZZ
MGNIRADNLWSDLFHIAYKSATDEECKKYLKNTTDVYPSEFFNQLVKRSYGKLLKFVFNHNNPRLAFQVLGVFILDYGLKMPDDIRRLILSHSDWESERDQLKNEQDRAEREKWLLDFKERIENYVEGISVNIPHETPRDTEYIDRRPIIY